MNHDNGSARLYRVSCPGPVLDAFKRLHVNARVAGHGKALLAAVKLLYQRLRTDPLNLGELCYHLPASGARIRVAVVAP